MVNKQLDKQRGFTLVEIAIVLVIIGLLLGGILKGQELITAARVRSLADLASGVQTAYYGFVDRYRAVPGDMTQTAACAAVAGTACAATGGGGNGTIDPGNFEEAASVWSHMAAAGFLQGNYAGVAADDAAYVLPGPPPVAPTNAWTGPLLLGVSPDYLDATAPPPARLLLIMGRSVPVNIMREVDTKVDDSLPESGIFRSGPIAAAATAFPTVGDSNATCVDDTAAPAVWAIAAGEPSCNGYYLY